MVGTPARCGTAWREGIYLQVAFPERMKEEDKKVGVSCAVRRARVLPSVITPYVLSRLMRARWVACVSKRVGRRYNCEVDRGI